MRYRTVSKYFHTWQTEGTQFPINQCFLQPAPLSVRLESSWVINGQQGDPLLHIAAPVVDGFVHRLQAQIYLMIPRGFCMK